MTRKAITTSHAVVSCDVCGRTLLRGEHADVFLHGGQRRMVCELCTPRAAHEGWIREGMDDARVRDRGERRSRSLLGRLRTRLAEVPAQPEPGAAPETEYEAPPLEPVPEPEPEPEYQPQPVEPVAVEEESQAPRSVHAVPTNADLKIARAVELFNVSEHPRTVSGVARSLGAPVVAVRPSQTEGSVVMIVVAWELSWYRYEVDLGNEAAGVRVTEQGSELAELDPDDQTANAAADETGRLHLAA
ncbi:MAG: hypothetical protein E6G41_11595 [Actinobacteria bacterium]|nr:MAG: hypothetical protein E6G41_11595 [Actinomycetota bacterium]